MVQYKVIKYTGVKAFDIGIKEETADLWIPFMNHTVYYDENKQAMYTQIYSKFINEPDKTK